MRTMIDILKQSKVIPVIVIHDLDNAIPLAEALVGGGLKVLEVTLRTPIALEAIKLIKQALPEAIVGTGTVTCPDTLNASLEVAADFVVSPGVTKALLSATQTLNINFLPGAATPSEAMRLLDEGYTCQKFFPAEAAGGAKMLQSLSGPLPQITFCPTGGISLTNAQRYLNLKNVACVGGSWMLDEQLIQQKDWAGIKRLATQANDININ